ncbi:isoprenylcysteine carboxyl methyltransferase family protein [Ornithinibacillus scapharcae]|uniref:isoprenylcysteine carboxyl methyltransferase family protein n=1 Tax=Ornithinibacillus scapharcae TaxID=1147159 RepID=UPI000225B5A2|nr:isoprenylcysteine carboxylmethyltransferase family protein [Ornithinibacillus scapharcae]
MELWMWILLFFIIGQRLIELIIAKNNEKWMKARGGIEAGSDHYKWFVYLHVLFFISILLETISKPDHVTNSINYLYFTVFIAAQLARVWCIHSLGRFWNTKIIILPRVALIRKGPYKYIKHPNYVIVAVELFIIPMLFGAYITAIVFPILHISLLRIRIPAEEKALASTSKL